MVKKEYIVAVASRLKSVSPGWTGISKEAVDAFSATHRDRPYF